MFQGRSFAAKLVMLAAVTSGLAVLTTAVLLLTIQWLNVEPAAREEARYMAATIAAAIPLALTLEDESVINERLQPFSRDPRALGAYVYRAGRLFTHFQHEGEALESPPPRPVTERQFLQEGWRLYVTEPVIGDDGVQSGLLVLLYDLRPGYERVLQNIYWALGIGALAMVGSLVLAMRLQRVLAKPVAELASTARRVTQTKSYALRAERYSNDELGLLTDDFNEMLQRIEQRDVELKEAQEALGLSEERFRKIVNNALDAVVTMDGAGTITGWNTQAERTFGWLATEAIGQTLGDLIVPPLMREAHRMGLERFAQTGEGPVLNRRIELTALRRGGEEFPVELAVTALRLEGAVHFSAFIQDITQRKRAEEALRLSEERYRLLVEGVRDYAIFMLDPQGRIASWNEGARNLAGYGADEALDKDFSIFYIPAEIAEGAPRHDLEQARRDGRVENEGWRARKDGSQFWANVILTAMYDPQGRLVGFSQIIRDLTERKRNEEALARERSLLRALIDNAPDCIFIKDSDCRFLMNNPAHLRMLGAASQDQAEGKSDADFFPRSLAERYMADDLKVLRSGQPLLNREEPVVGADGTWRWMSASKIPLAGPDGKPNRIVGLSRDITDLREARERLEQINAELTQKNQEMEQFVYTVSHDLKSPIVTCVGFLGLMREDIQSHQFEAVEDSMQRLERAVGRMHQSINDLLELSRVGRVRTRPEQVDMDGLMRHLAEEMAPRLRDHGIRLEVQPDLPSIIADPMRVTEIFENLVTNAIKYAGDVPEPRIEIGAADADEEVRFFVRDNGPGIAPDYHRRIFGLFQRLDNKKEGTGVGLTIVQRIMEVHGGRVWVESEVGRGATFWLAFPLAVVHPEEQVAAGPTN